MQKISIQASERRGRKGTRLSCDDLDFTSATMIHEWLHALNSKIQNKTFTLEQIEGEYYTKDNAKTVVSTSLEGHVNINL